MGAFDGVRVVELSTGVAGPLVGMFLADFGADVVKVEGPAGDPARALPGFAMWNRNKRAVLVDPADRQRCAWLAELLSGADVCLVPGPEVLAAYGIDADELAARHPGLIVAQTPPYEGPTPWTGGGESDGLLAAATGVARRQSSADGGPVEEIYPYQLYIQGALAATATVAALIERERSGFGQTVTVTGVHAVMETSSGSLTIDPAMPEPISAVGPGGPHPFYTRYQGSDGEWFFCGALVPPAQHRFLGALGLADILDDPRLGGVIETVLMPENRGWVRARFVEVLSTQTRDEWLARFEEFDIPTGPLLDRDGWLDHEQVIAIGMRTELDDPERGRVVMPSNPLTFTATPARVDRAAPGLGQDDADVALWPARPVPVGSPPVSSGPLAGYRFLNLGTYLAGPYAGVLLADLGADVIKVEPPAGDPFRVPGYTYNRGVRGVALDLRRPSAQAAFHRLVATADVVTDNSRAGVLDRLGAGYATLSGVKADIVTVSCTGFGEGGPLSYRPGFDPVMQAMSGMMRAQGGDGEPVMFTIPINDVTAAVLSALGACIGLFHRVRSGQGQRIWTSLIGASAYMQSGELVRYPGRPPARLGGRDFQGRDPFDRFYPVRDGWVRVHATAGFDPAGLVSAGIVPDADALSTDPTAAMIGALAGLYRDEAADRLNGAGLAAAPARTFTESREDKALQAAEFTQAHQRSDGLRYLTPGPMSAFSRTPRRGPLRAPGVGEHTRAVLTDAGLSDAELDALIVEGVSAQGAGTEPVFFVSYR